MNRYLLMNIALASVLLLSSLVVLPTGAEEGTIPVPEERTVQDGIVQAPHEKVWDIEELVEIGAAEMRTFDAANIDELMAQLRDDWFSETGKTILNGPAPGATGKDENDGFDNATWVEDGDEVENNVTTWIASNTLHPSDIDMYMVNLSVNVISGVADKLILDIYSTDAEDKNASLATDFFFPDTLFGQWINLDFEVTGKHHGNHSRFVFVPKSDPFGSGVLPIAFQFLSWNSTTIDYSFTVDIQTATSTSMNGDINNGEFVNGTIKPSAMQRINISHEYYDWFDLTAVITDEGLQTARGDMVKMSLKVDAALEERGQMFGYAGPVIYGKPVNMTSIAFIFFLWHNYSSNQFSLATVGNNNIPFVGQLFGNDPVNVGFNAQADAAFIGLSPLKLWLAGTQAFQGAEGNAQYEYNLTNIKAEILPPNDPPFKTGNIPNLVFDEDTGPWENVVDLEEYFNDDWSDGDLRFVVKPSGIVPPGEIQVGVAPDGRHLRINVTEDNWFTAAPLSYIVEAYDWGVDWKRNSGDDEMALSNVFKVTINPVNDDAFIEKVDTIIGQEDNDHQWVQISTIQGKSTGWKKIYGKDNDTIDLNRLEYSHNATIPSFRIDDKGRYEFTPRNEDVGTHWIRITIDDTNPPSEDDYLLLKFVVTNINDGPTLVSLKNRETGDLIDLEREDEVRFYNVLEDKEVNLTVIAEDVDIAIGQPDRLSWNIGSVGWVVTPEPEDPFKAYVTYTPTNDDAIVGEVSSTLSVRDSQQEQSKEIRITLYVENVNDPPTIVSVNEEFVENGQVTLDASSGKNGYEDQLYILKVIAADIDPRDAVEFSSNDQRFTQIPMEDDDFGTTFQMMPTQDLVGVHQLIITVKDKKDKTSSVRVNYEIVNTNDPPDEPKIQFSAPNGLKVDELVEFTAEDYNDIDGDELVFEWNFGDGSELVYGEEVEHVFRAALTYTVTLIARDPAGAEGIARKTVTIAEKEVIIDPNLDTDQDGMPDWWEEQYSGFDKNDPSDAEEDFDDDDFTNLEEFTGENGKSTNPLDKNDHPTVIATPDEEDNTLLIIIIVVIVLLVIVIVAILAFVMRGPKQVQQQQMYMPELAPAQLPPKAPVAPTLPPKPQPQLPPKKEEDLLEGFMEEAAKEVQESMDAGQEEDNVWRPPAPEEETHSQVDDLFEEEGDAKGPAGPPAGLAPPPKLPEMD